MIFTKGVVLLAEAAVLYGLAPFRGFYFLGMFPLSWLAVSRFQWGLCAMPEYRYWAWLALFLGAEILILALPDGKKLLFPLVPLWAVLIWLFKFSFLLPLVFIRAPEKRFPRAAWARWGGLAAALVLYFLFKGWVYFSFTGFGWILKFLFLLPLSLVAAGAKQLRQSAWTRWGGMAVALVLFFLFKSWDCFLSSDFGLYDLFVGNRFLAFFIVGWLGLAAFDSTRKGIFRHTLVPLFLLPAGFLFWGGTNFVSTFIEFEILQWVLVWMAGYGWEAFRKYMIDPTWHGRLVWAALGLAFFGGVL